MTTTLKRLMAPMKFFLLQVIAGDVHVLGGELVVDFDLLLLLLLSSAIFPVLICVFLPVDTTRRDEKPETVGDSRTRIFLDHKSSHAVTVLLDSNPSKD